jgi:hypothetical protein
VTANLKEGVGCCECPQLAESTYSLQILESCRRVFWATASGIQPRQAFSCQEPPVAVAPFNSLVRLPCSLGSSHWIGGTRFSRLTGSIAVEVIQHVAT